MTKAPDSPDAPDAPAVLSRADESIASAERSSGEKERISNDNSPSTSPSHDQVASPSYMISAVGGLFLGILGMAIMLFFVSLPEDKQWFIAILPIVGLLASILGTYVSAEPYDELRVNYDRLAEDAASVVKSKVDESRTGQQARLDEIRERLLKESMRLATEAAELGADGIKIAEAAEIMRREAENCVN